MRLHSLHPPRGLILQLAPCLNSPFILAQLVDEHLGDRHLDACSSRQLRPCYTDDPPHGSFGSL